MTRAEVEKAYNVVGGVIISPGPYALAPVYAPHYVELGENGGADRVEPFEDGPTLVFEIDASDVEHWPELAKVKTLRVWCDPSGSVHVGQEMQP